MNQRSWRRAAVLSLMMETILPGTEAVHDFGRTNLGNTHAMRTATATSARTGRRSRAGSLISRMRATPAMTLAVKKWQCLSAGFL